jgi:hypothetical protein
MICSFLLGDCAWIKTYRCAFGTFGNSKAIVVGVCRTIG